VRVLFHGNGAQAGLREDKKAFAEFILNAPEQELIKVTDVTIDAPEAARIRNSVICEGCSEPVMDTRIREIKGRRLCIPCAEESK
jgi:formylmethanofuran dehydrogenase subunit E